MAHLGVLLKTAGSVEPFLSILSGISVAYLLIYGLITWIRNHPDEWQQQLDTTGISFLIRWAKKTWENLRVAKNVNWHL